MNLFESLDQARTFLKSGMVLRVRKNPSTEDTYIRITYPPSFSSSMGIETLHFNKPKRLTKLGRQHQHQPERLVCSLSEIRGVEIR